MSEYKIGSSYGTSTNAQGKLTCDANVPKPAKVLDDKEITSLRMTGAQGGFIVGLLAGGIPAVVTTPVGWLIGNGIAKETNEQASEINTVSSKFAANAEADLAAAGCDASNTTYAPGSRWGPELPKKK